MSLGSAGHVQIRPVKRAARTTSGALSRPISPRSRSNPREGHVCFETRVPIQRDASAEKNRQKRCASSSMHTSGTPASVPRVKVLKQEDTLHTWYCAVYCEEEEPSERCGSGFGAGVVLILKFSYGGVGDEGLRACGSGERLKAGAHRSELVPPEDGMPSRDLASAECPGAVDVGALSDLGLRGSGQKRWSGGREMSSGSVGVLT